MGYFDCDMNVHAVLKSQSRYISYEDLTLVVMGEYLWIQFNSHEVKWVTLLEIDLNK